MAGNILGTTVYYDADCNVAKIGRQKNHRVGLRLSGSRSRVKLKNGMDVTIGLREGSKS